MELTREDAGHLRMLSIGHYVVAVLQAIASLFPLIHFTVGAALVFAPEKMGANAKNEGFVGWLFMIFAIVLIFSWLTLAACIALAGRFLARRRYYTYCFLVAVFEAAMCMPFGTILGILTIVVLLRPAVKRDFGFEGNI